MKFTYGSVQFLLLGLVLFVQGSWSLTCYQTDDESGKIHEVTSDDFVYCSLFPAIRHPKTGKLVHAQVDGTVREEIDGPFQKFFDMQEPYYQVLSICLYERYDFSKMMTSSKVEYQFRCICNTDLCNTPSTFEPYIGNLMRKSQDNEVESA